MERRAVVTADHVTMYTSSVAGSGSGQAHPNMQPYVCVNFIIAMTGVYPPQN